MALSKTFVTFLFIMGAASIQAASLFDKLSSSDQRTWRLLLHYDSSESRADDELFFVHPQGKFDLSAELEAFVAEYKNPSPKVWGRFKASLGCTFPARVNFLSRIEILKKKNETCVEWEKWQREIAPHSLSIVFSTAYPNNPGSMFGHTFLRFKNKKGQKDLLDYSANYSAITSGTDGGFMYAMKGIFGGYRGFFDLHPHYMLVNDYVHSENRDLIEYHLKLTQGQIDTLFSHLWELYQAGSFDYFFTWENCSFHLAEFLNLVLKAPLRNPKRFYYLPVDLIHALEEKPGLIRKITQRPSQKRSLQKVMASLSSDEVTKVRKLFEGSAQDLTKLSLKELDALIYYLNFYKFKVHGEMEEQKASLYPKVLMERAKRGKASKDLEFEPFENQPHLAHQAQRLSIGGFTRKDQEGVRLSYRAGYHELLSPDAGLDAFSQFYFLSPTLSLGKVDGKFKAVLEEMSLVEIVSLHPQTFYDSQLSWKVGGRYERFLYEDFCQSCGRFLGEGKLGVSFGDRAFIFSALFGGVAEYAGRLKDSFRLNGAYEFIAGLQGKRIKLVSQFEGRFDVAHIKEQFTHRLKVGVTGIISKDNTVRLVGRNLWRSKKWDQAGHDLSLEWGMAF